MLENRTLSGAHIIIFCSVLFWIDIGLHTGALSYLTGKTMILDLREQAMIQDGKSFRPGDFHDKLLSNGSIPPALMAEIYGWSPSIKTSP
jgi:hypothetical protein